MHRNTGYQDMSSTKSLISFSTMEFLKLVDYRDKGVHPGRGWGYFGYVTCPICMYAWEAVAKFNTRGKECPSCGHCDENFIWIELVPYKGEGAMLNPVGEGYDIVTPN